MVDNNLTPVSSGEVIDPPVAWQAWLKEFLYSKAFASLMLILLTAWFGKDAATYVGISVQVAQELIPTLITLLVGLGLSGRFTSAVKKVQLKEAQKALVDTSNANAELVGKVEALTQAHQEVVRQVAEQDPPKAQ